ncbi:MAG TPA: hypothetical protein VGR35_18825 [Tepidisphaeraceae bacterium]|nr:hypothetical protein [Tepidisphaeraceae bacterium]
MTNERTTRPEPREAIVLEYRSRGTSRQPLVGPVQWLKASLVLGVASWATFGPICAGATSTWVWLPVSLAAAGLLSGVVAAVGALPRDYTGGALLAIFMGFTVLAIWLLALALF